MKYLVLGSSGQIGAELCIFLKKQGHKVTEFDIVKNYEESATVEDEDLEEEYEAQGTEEDYAQPWQSVDNSKHWQWTVDQMTKNITLKDVEPSSNGYNPNADKR